MNNIFYYMFLFLPTTFNTSQHFMIMAYFTQRKKRKKRKKKQMQQANKDPI